VDDIIIYDRDFSQHMQHLRQVFDALRGAGLKVKFSKTVFAASSLPALGRVVSEAGISPDPEKVRAIEDLPPPKDVTAIKSFLGMVGYYRSHIHDFGTLAAPLQNLTKGKVPYNWSFECEDSWLRLKVALTSAPILRLPDWMLPFHLCTDWSKVAVGAVLSQTDPITLFEHPIAFASRACSGAESNYSPTEGELLALVWACHKFRPYIHGYHFHVYTDHAALQWLECARFQNSKLERWALRLQEFSFDVKHKKGSDNLIADCLSRSAISEPPPPKISNIWPEEYFSQQQLDSIPCTACNDPRGDDNIVICEGCQRCFHLRCLIPPLTTAPSGSWFCPACDPKFLNLDELRDPRPVLQYHTRDPFLCPELQDFLLRGDDALPSGNASKSARRSIIMRASRLKPHHIAGWLWVFKVLRNKTERWLVCPPLEYRWDIIRVVHETLGHAGIEQTLVVMHQHFHWPGIKEDIQSLCRVCDSCQKQKLILASPPDMQQPAIYGPLKHVHIDLAGPFLTHHYDVEGRLLPQQAPYKSWVVLMIDYFTKIAEFAVIPGKSPAFISKAFYDLWISRYGVPEYLTSDNGTEFAGEFVHMLARLGIHHVHSSAYHPASNGVVERLVRSFKSILASHINDQPSSWVFSLPHVRSAYMNRVHSTLGVTPNEMLMGFAPRLPLPIASICVVELSPASTSLHEPECLDASEFVLAVQKHLVHLDEQALLGIHRQFHDNHAALKRRRAASRHRQPRLTVGDLVLELDETAGSLNAQARGPYRIVGLKEHSATLQTQDTKFKERKTFERHKSRLAIYYDRSSLRS
jgi:hypothetical protein